MGRRRICCWSLVVEDEPTMGVRGGPYTVFSGLNSPHLVLEPLNVKSAVHLSRRVILHPNDRRPSLYSDGFLVDIHDDHAVEPATVDAMDPCDIILGEAAFLLEFTKCCLDERLVSLPLPSEVTQLPGLL